MEVSKYLMKKVILAAGIIIFVVVLALYKVGEDMSTMSRCGCHYRF